MDESFWDPPKKEPPTPSESKPEPKYKKKMDAHKAKVAAKKRTATINRNNAMASAKSLAYFILSDSQYRMQLIARCRAGTVNPGIEAMLWHYVLGKPTEVIQLSVDDGKRKDISQLSDTELQEELILLRKKGEEVLNKGDLN